MKRCYTCEKRKPIGDFYRDKRLKDGRRYQCKACTKTRVITPAQKQRHDAQKRAWRATNKTRTAAYGRVWYAKNKARLQAEYSANRAEHLVASARSRARIKRVPFRLTAADILPAIAAGVCEMTGVPFDFTGRRSARIPSLDRIHPKKDIYLATRALSAGK